MHSAGRATVKSFAALSEHSSRHERNSRRTPPRPLYLRELFHKEELLGRLEALQIVHDLAYPSFRAIIVALSFSLPEAVPETQHLKGLVTSYILSAGDNFEQMFAGEDAPVVSRNAGPVAGVF